MKTSNYLIALGAAVFLSACNVNISNGENGNGKVVTEEREITADFLEVRGSAGLEVYLTQGNENKIVVEADENLQQYIETDVEDGKLKITTSRNIGRSTAKKVYVTFKQLNAVEASSGAEVTGNSIIKSQDLSLKCSSGADLDVEVFAQNLTAKASSGAEMEVSGKATYLTADASSGSELNAKELLVLQCSAEASSGAEITVNVKEKLETNVGSGGDINYYGNPLSVNSNKSHSGSVHKM
jgi:hypothetical protein